ncbi:MAG: DUF3899 domain-containing protein [Firmicutes bacterium]|nr:DUF3899 domain-containing protein [Bacillota bacterium]
MSERGKQFLISMGVGLAVAIGVFFLNSQDLESIAGRISDGCFVAAVVLLGFGGLVFARNQGTFDMMAYSVSSVFRIHVPGSAIGKEKEDFADYKERKAAARKSPSGMLLAGVIYLVVSLVLLGVYYLL